jgi:hypothetical protein
MLLEPQRAVPFVVAVEDGAVRVLIREGAPAPECGISVGTRPPQSVPTPIEWITRHA